MATVSTLSFAEKVALPFCVVVPVGVGIIGYFIWKRDTSSLSSSSSLSKDHYVNADSTVSSDEVDVMETVNTSAGGMNRKMAMWFMASCAAMIGLALFHVVRNLMAATDYRIGMLGFGGALVVAMCAAMFSVTLRITDEADLFLNKRYEVCACFFSSDFKLTLCLRIGGRFCTIGQSHSRRNWTHYPSDST